jgi:ankyrin repeat protein
MMGRSAVASAVNLLAAGILAASLLTGCAGMPGGSADSERLHNAVALDDLSFVQDAVQSGKLHVNQHVRSPGFPEGAPVILIAARYASLKTLRYLISAGANVNARAPTGETALMLASYFQGDDGQVRTSSQDAYMQAARMLVESGASLENAPHNYTPLAYAAYAGHNRIVRYLLERGARVNADAEDGVIYVNTPLMMAAIQGHVETTVWLLRAGADPRVRVYLGHTAAELAMKNNHSNIAGLLRCAENAGPGDGVARCLSR